MSANGRRGARRAGRRRSERRATVTKRYLEVRDEASLRRVERDAEGFFSAYRGRSGGALIPETIENREKMEGTGGEVESEKQRETEVGLGRTHASARARTLGRFATLAENRSRKKIRGRARVSAARALR